MIDYRPLIICQTCREPTRHSHARDHVIRVNAKAVSVQHHYACGTCGTLRVYGHSAAGTGAVKEAA